MATIKLHAASNESLSNDCREVKLLSARQLQHRWRNPRPVSCSLMESIHADLVMDNKGWHFSLGWAIHLFHGWEERKHRARIKHNNASHLSAPTPHLFLQNANTSFVTFCCFWKKKTLLFTFILSEAMFCLSRGILLMLRVRGKTQSEDFQLDHFTFPYLCFRVESLANTPAWASLS